eukprot:3430135-Pleurochrysis_carterae.AAC.1
MSIRDGKEDGSAKLQHKESEIAKKDCCRRDVMQTFSRFESFIGTRTCTVQKDHAFKSVTLRVGVVSASERH